MTGSGKREAGSGMRNAECGKRKAGSGKRKAESGFKTSHFYLLILHFLLTILLSISSRPPAFDVVIINGRIVDGTGNPWYRADIGIKNGEIVFIGRFDSGLLDRTTIVIDAGDQVVSPGFIDVHTHIEQDEIRNPTADNFIYDGVTTVITGNCGDSHVDIDNYFRLLDSLKMSVNVATLIGHNDVRKQVMGTENRLAREAELKQMEALVEKAMKDGAVGLSTGLIYVPGTFAPSDEIIRLAQVAARYEGIYATHMRNESDSVVEAINESLMISKAAKIPLQISHFKVGGQPVPGKSRRTLAMIVAAREEGIDVTIDQYPYTASSTSLSSLLPSEILTGNADSIRIRLSNSTLRKAVISTMLRKLKQRGKAHYDFAVVTRYAFDSTLNGKSIAQINKLKKRPHTAEKEAETILEMMIHGGAGMVFHGMWEEDIRNIIKYPFNMIGSDASIRVFGEGHPHPRGYGSNARFLAKYVRETNLVSLEEGVRRMTSLPANRFSLGRRGLIAKGYVADIVVFDDNTIQDNSTYEKPHAYSSGISTVLVNGRLVIRDSKHTGARPGTVVRRSRS